MKTKTYLLTPLILFTLSISCFSQGYSSAENPTRERKNASPDLEKSKEKMISFHMLKVVDH